MSHRPRVFISYCRSDGLEFSTKLRKRLQSECPEITLWQDIISERGGCDWWLQITEALDVVEYMVLIMTPDALNSLTVRKEWRYARQQGVSVYPVLGVEKIDFNKLPRWIRDKHFYDLDLQWKKFINDLNTHPDAQRVPFMVADLQEGFIQRPLEFDSLVALLRDAKREEPVAITAALKGAGGYGKTTLARALCHDERIQEAFDDGILWVTLGENPGDLKSKIMDFIEVLSGERPGFSTDLAASARLRELLAERDILMVVDDVWSSIHLRPFLNGGPRCARLITTRNHETVPYGTQFVNVDAMQPSEAISLLGAAFEPTGVEKEQLSVLAQRLGQWPLLLQLVNRVLRERVHEYKQTLPAAIDYARRALAKWGLTAFDERDAKAREQAVATTVEVSLELLTTNERARYLELAVFPEDVDIPLRTIETLWHSTGGLDELDTEQLCVRLHGLCLLLDCDLSSRDVRLHDVMRTFLASRLPAKVSLNAKLIDAWSDPYHLPNSYAWRFFSYHMIEADRCRELCDFLMDFNWICAKLQATDLNALIADYDRVPEYHTDCRLLQVTLKLSSHALSAKDRSSQLPSQLIGRLYSKTQPGVRRMLKQARHWKGSCWLRPLTASLTPPGGPLMATLVGHSGFVNAVVFTPDDRTVVSASQDRTLRVWDVQTGTLLRTLLGHSDEIWTVALTPDGTQAVSASKDRTLKVWDLKGGTLLRTLIGHSDCVSALVLTIEGARAISVSLDRTVKVWDVNSGRLLHTLVSHTDQVWAVAVVPDGVHAVSASRDRTLKVWNLNTGTLVNTLVGHGAAVRLVATTPDGMHIVSASDDGTLNIWDRKTGTLLHSLQAHTERVLVLAFTPDGTIVCSASRDETIKMWEVATGKLVYSVETSITNAVALFEDGTKAISAGSDSLLRVWNVKTGELLYSLSGHSAPAKAIALTKNGTIAVSASGDRTLKVWSLRPCMTPESDGDRVGGAVHSVAVTRDGAWAVSAHADSSLSVWEIRTGRCLRTLKGHDSAVFAVALTPDGTLAVSASIDQTLKVWAVKTGKLLHTLSGHSGAVWAVAVTPDGSKVISASADHTLKVWAVKTGKLLHTLSGHSDDVWAVAVTADGSKAVSASTDHTLKLWEVKTGELLHTLFGHRDSVKAVVVTPDDSQIVSASDDGTLKVWGIQAGQLLHSLSGHDGVAFVLALSPDGTHAVSASNDGTLQIWQIHTARLLRVLKGHRLMPYRVAVTADGMRTISTSFDGTLKVWEMNTGELLSTFEAGAYIYSCAIAPDGKTLIAGDALNRVHFLRVEGPETSGGHNTQTRLDFDGRG